MPYSSLLNRRIPVSDRRALPEAAGVYAWWVLEDVRQAEAASDGASVRPLYLGAAKNLAVSVADDAVGLRDTVLRLRLAAAMGEQIGLRPRKDMERRQLTIEDRQRMDHWINAHLLVSWSEVPHPAAYRDALVRALDPQFKP